MSGRRAPLLLVYQDIAGMTVADSAAVLLFDEQLGIAGPLPVNRVVIRRPNSAMPLTTLFNRRQHVWFFIAYVIRHFLTALCPLGFGSHLQTKHFLSIIP